MKAVFIINPISGTRSKDELPELIERLLDKSKFEYRICLTRYAGHASEIARDCVNQHVDVVVAVGGDGTVNEVARSVAHSETALAIIPCGSGNGLARHLCLPMDPEESIRIINQYHVEALDYGIINGLPFFCTCGVGFDAFISLKFAEAGKRGPMTYIENVLKEGLKYKPETYEVEDETGAYRYKAFLIACANASQYGNNVYIAPSASMTDGLMDVTLLEPFNLLEAPQVVVQLLNKTIDKNPHARTFQCRSMHIRRTEPGVVHYDGDPMECGTDIDVRIVPHGIRVVVNNDEQALASPLRSAFFDIQDKMQQEMNKLREDFVEQGERIKRINSELLKMLKV